MRRRAFSIRYDRILPYIVGLFTFGILVAYATPPTSPYNPGETLDPACAAGSTNCSVKLPSLAVQTNSAVNGSQSLLNLVAGTNVTLTDNGTGSVTINAAGGGGSAPTLQTNGTPNGSQSLLNLTGAGGTTATDNGSGTVTIQSPISVGTSGNTLYSSGLSGSGQGATGSSNDYDIFFGVDAGNGASFAHYSTFIGRGAGYQTSGSLLQHSNFIGYNAGYTANAASFSNFIGYNAGYQATSASSSNFIGNSVGTNATNASNSNFIGTSVGTNATSASNSNFIGQNTGQNATSASNSNFFGYGAGGGATNASSSNFIGNGAGNGATNASISNLFGYHIGQSFSSNNIGSNNIIIGTNISLPDATANAINIGGILFGTGSYATTSGNPSIAAQTSGKIGIGIVPANETASLNIAASTTGQASLRLFAGTAPTSPNDGDIWNDSAVHHLYARLNGSTYQLDQQNGGGSGPTLQTNGTPNGSQSLLNLVAGSNVTLTDNGSGNVTIAAAGGGGGTTYTAGNGLTLNGSEIDLGGTLAQSTTINTVSNSLTVSGSVGSAGVLDVSNSNSSAYGIYVSGLGSGISINASGPIGANINTSGLGILATSSSSTAIIASSVSSTPVIARVTPSSGNVITDGLQLSNNPSVSVANGLGTSLQFSLKTTNNNEFISNKIVSRWTDATTASRTSEFSITGVNNATESTLFTLAGSGALKLNKYGSGAFTGTATHSLLVDASGNVIEGAVGGGSGTVTSVGLTAPTGFTVTGSPVTSSGTLALTTTLSGLVYGTGSGLAALADPNANKIVGWDDTDNSNGYWTLGGGLSYDHASHTLSTPISIGTSGTTLYSSGLPGTGQGDTVNGNDIFLGSFAGDAATNVNGSNFIGFDAGQNATDASNSTFIGSYTGKGSASASASVFIGYDVGESATNAANSVFIGPFAGITATNADSSNFIGYDAGSLATGATRSNFIGNEAGNNAANASYSNLFGYRAGAKLGTNNIGTNNIIIGTNISLPNATANAINLGGVLFGTGTQNDTNPANLSITAQTAGKIGIATIPTTYTLEVGNNSITGIVARFTDSAGTCDINPATASLSCSSDQTLKKNITPLDGSATLSSASILDKVLSLTPVTYNWNSETDGTAVHTGFIAQSVQQVFPDLVSQDPTTHLLSLNYIGLVPYTIRALQEMNLQLKGINDIASSNPLRDQLIAWFANAGNHITRIFTGEVCLTDPDGSSECINKSELTQLKQLIAQPAPQSPAPQQPADEQTTDTTTENSSSTDETNDQQDQTTDQTTDSSQTENSSSTDPTTNSSDQSTDQPSDISTQDSSSTSVTDQPIPANDSTQTVPVTTDSSSTAH